MGMDVYGRNPSGEVGNYFRNNMWWWRPLWNYCEWLVPELIPKDNDGHANCGWGLDAEGAEALAEKLREELASGRCRQFALGYECFRTTLPLELCTLCGGTGIRSDALGIEHGWPEQVNPHTGKQGWCNGCDGKGHKPPFAANYPFSVENVASFVSFLEACGGFEIW